MDHCCITSRTVVDIGSTQVSLSDTVVVAALSVVISASCRPAQTNVESPSLCVISEMTKSAEAPHKVMSYSQEIHSHSVSQWSLLLMFAVLLSLLSVGGN